VNYSIKITVGILLMVAITTSCNRKDKQKGVNHPAKCIKINDTGVNYLMNYPLDGEKGLDKAIELFKQAINGDSTNAVFYINLSAAYDKKHKRQDQMNTFNKLLSLTANEPFVLMRKAMLFEIMGCKDSANKVYRLTSLEYKKTP
jgi:tetratricopeptide (TPR) repeat protein